jgi:hypothetical protein
VFETSGKNTVKREILKITWDLWYRKIKTLWMKK